MNRKQGNILNISISGTTKTRVLSYAQAKCSQFNLESNNYKPYLITTPNPEIVMIASEDTLLTKILNSSDISLPDGAGLVAAYRFLKMRNTDNKLLRPFLLIGQGIYVGFEVFVKKDLKFDGVTLIKGREMFVDMIKLANRNSWKVFLFGGEADEAEQALNNLKINYKKVKIDSFAGPIYGSDGKPTNKEGSKQEKLAIDKINTFKPHMLFVGLGAPKQEKWLNRNLRRLDVGGAMVVGGTFNFISGNTKLPPAWIDDLSLEWLWRGITKPGHLGRALNAAIIFPLKVYFYKLTKS